LAHPEGIFYSMFYDWNICCDVISYFFIYDICILLRLLNVEWYGKKKVKVTLVQALVWPIGEVEL
jgi:hypothetical protein